MTVHFNINRPNETHRQPATALPVGTMVIMCTSMAQWLKCHCSFQDKFNEYNMLNMLRFQPLKVQRRGGLSSLQSSYNQPSGSWSYNRFSERFLAGKKGYRSQSPNCMTHCYAIGAFNALHVLEHHLETIKIRFTHGFY